MPNPQNVVNYKTPKANWNRHWQPLNSWNANRQTTTSDWIRAIKGLLSDVVSIELPVRSSVVFLFWRNTFFSFSNIRSVGNQIPVFIITAILNAFSQPIMSIHGDTGQCETRGLHRGRAHIPIGILVIWHDLANRIWQTGCSPILVSNFGLAYFNLLP